MNFIQTGLSLQLSDDNEPKCCDSIHKDKNEAADEDSQCGRADMIKCRGGDVRHFSDILQPIGVVSL